MELRADAGQINQLISNAASQHVRSPISPLTKNVAVGKDRIVSVVTVPKGLDKPYFDRKGIIWLKGGSGQRPNPPGLPRQRADSPFHL